MTGDLSRTLTTLFPDGGTLELRALADHSVHSGYFDDFGLLIEKAEALDGMPEVAGIYVTLNIVNPALLSRRSNRVKMNLGYKEPATGDGDILRRRWLPVDLDPVRPAGVSSTDAEHGAALARAGEVAAWLSSKGFPEPVRGDSGNGAHLLYRIDLPNDEEATRLVRGTLTLLNLMFSDENVQVDPANFNAARIWKLYGTVSRKGDNTPDRPHRRSAIVSMPGTVEPVPAELLRSLIGILPVDDPGQGKKGSPGNIDLREWLSGHGLGVRTERPWQGGTLFNLRECPFSGSHRDGAFAVQFPGGAVYAGCHHASCGGGAQRWPELRSMFESNPRSRRGQARSREAAAAREVPPPPVPPSPAVIPGIHEKAEEVLGSGDPPGFILDVFHREHVGDRAVAECLLLSVASQAVENTHGLHVAISGNSGKGKSHACRTMLDLVPEQYRMKGTVSNKALYYHPVEPGTVMLFDDIMLSEDLQEILKSATANFREPIEHRTLTSDRQVRICRIPERCIWWLAKVETAGDDQLMNRMLCVWIDDSAEQDAAVLNHQKESEAREVPGYNDPDVLVCRAILAQVKAEVIHVRIPFAPQIHFSVAQNRRNPGMLFDLIKCRARLFFRQRERDSQGNILATCDDFVYARALFLELAGGTGAQETKLTRNESAALGAIQSLGLQVFTIKHLQDAIGLSYFQVYRLLKGNNSAKGSTQGILDKCPAVSYIDATVAEDLYGVAIKRREHYFSFDPILYRIWITQSQIWLDNERQVCRVADDLHPGSENEGNGDSGPQSSVADVCTSKNASKKVSCRNCTGTHSTSSGSACTVPGVCDPEQTAIPAGKIPNHSDPGNPASHIARLVCRDARNAVHHGRKSGTIDPLPGVLDHREFERVNVPSSKCDVCHEGSAVFWCREKRVGICEGCYTKLVREWNGGNGVR